MATFGPVHPGSRSCVSIERSLPWFLQIFFFKSSNCDVTSVLRICGESRENENTYRLAESRHQRNLSKIQAQALDPELSVILHSIAKYTEQYNDICRIAPGGLICAWHVTTDDTSENDCAHN